MAETFSRGTRTWAERRSCMDFLSRGVGLTGSATGSGVTAEMSTAGAGVESGKDGGAAAGPKLMHPPNPRRSNPHPPARLSRGDPFIRKAIGLRPPLHSNIRASLDHRPCLPRMSFFYLRFVTSGRQHTPIWLINATDGRSVSAILFFCRANLP